MAFTDVLQPKNISVYRLWKESGVPQATISDICTGKTSIEKMLSRNYLYAFQGVGGFHGKLDFTCDSA